ncbi:hypothetical protein ALT1000_650004 [Alteromonas macleodii]
MLSFHFQIALSSLANDTGASSIQDNIYFLPFLIDIPLEVFFVPFVLVLFFLKGQTSTHEDDMQT